MHSVYKTKSKWMTFDIFYLHALVSWSLLSQSKWLHYFSFRFTVWRSRQFLINNENISLPCLRKSKRDKRRESPENAFAIPETTPFNGPRSPQGAANQPVAGSLRTEAGKTAERRLPSSFCSTMNAVCVALTQNLQRPGEKWKT